MGEREKEEVLQLVNAMTNDEKELILSAIPDELIIGEIRARLVECNKIIKSMSDVLAGVGK